MQRSRQTLGYVVEVDGPFITVNLDESVRSHVAGSMEGISSFEQPGDLVALEAGSSTLVARVLTLSFLEPKELYQRRTLTKDGKSPLRQLKGCIIGLLEKHDGKLTFGPQTTRLPALGAQCLPLSGAELNSVLSNLSAANGGQVVVGTEARNPAIRVAADLDLLLSRHLAVLGATGQGKTHFVADIVQQLVDQKPKARVIVFDLNGEYFPAFKYLGKRVRYTAIGDRLGRNAPSNGQSLKIPYYALGRHGLFRLLLPSERTQAPALRFAIEHLPYVEGTLAGAKPVGSPALVFFDDCRPGDAKPAYDALNAIRAKPSQAKSWPPINALSCLVAESYAIEVSRNGYQRNSFNYGHVQSLISRINALITDSHFTSVVDVNGGAGATGSSGLSLPGEAAAVVDRLFGPATFGSNEASIHIIDLSQLAQDLMPIVLGPLLELFAEQLFRRGPGNTHPTLLVLEEAHHYLRQLHGDSEGGQHSLAYERLAKEGRKFGVSLLVSTQRPSELSPTVLAQCGTWATFRLTNELDKRAVTAAAEGTGLDVTNQIPGLSRGEAMVFGSAFQLPIRIARRPLAEDRAPDSLDPQFEKMWS